MNSEKPLVADDGQGTQSVPDVRSHAERGNKGVRRRVGIMAGWGRLPQAVAESLRRQGCEAYCLGTIGHADPALAEVCDDFHWLGLAKFGAAIRQATGHDLARHPALDGLAQLPRRRTVRPAAPASVREFIEQHT